MIDTPKIVIDIAAVAKLCPACLQSSDATWNLGQARQELHEEWDSRILLGATIDELRHQIAVDDTTIKALMAELKVFCKLQDAIDSLIKAAK